MSGSPLGPLNAGCFPSGKGRWAPAGGVHPGGSLAQVPGVGTAPGGQRGFLVAWDGGIWDKRTARSHCSTKGRLEPENRLRVLEFGKAATPRAYRILACTRRTYWRKQPGPTGGCEGVILPIGGDGPPQAGRLWVSRGCRSPCGRGARYARLELETPVFKPECRAACGVPPVAVAAGSALSFVPDPDLRALHAHVTLQPPGREAPSSAHRTGGKTGEVRQPAQATLGVRQEQGQVAAPEFTPGLSLSPSSDRWSDSKI